MDNFRRISFLLALLVAGCPSADREGTTAADAPTEGGAADPWASLSTADLVAMVREGAGGRIREVEPGFDLARLPEWRAAPETAPVLGDRVCEQLLNLAVADVAAGDLDGAEGTVRLVRARARNRNNAYAANTLLTEVLRRRAGDDEAAARAAIEGALRELPRARFGMATVVYQLFQARAQVEAQLGQIRRTLVSLDTAVTVLFMGEIVGAIVDHRPLYLAAVAAVQAEHEAAPAEGDYDFSTVDLAGAEDAQEIVVAVWDTGVDTALFSEQLFVNGAEQPNGEDDDDNGLVDDIHGIASDPDAAQQSLLYSPGEATVERYAPFLRGIMDLRAGMASSEAAQQVLELMRSATNPDALEELQRRLSEIGEWAHGTHVAGLVLSGVPQARVAVFRSAWAAESRIYWHRGPTDEELAAERQNVEAIAAFIRAHGVRVVNASLGFGVDYLEGELRHQSDLYRTDEEVRARARQIHEHRVRNWQWIFEQCPDTLFVVAAGNASRDVVEYNDVPAALEAPNLLVVGAVDRHGNWATFTSSSPERVRIFDFGVAVPSVVPGGDEVPLSGTSMASPNVANLATKLVALDPSLSPARVIEIIHETADPIAEPFYGRIPSEARAVELVRGAR